jgi:hypothetical protein
MFYYCVVNGLLERPPAGTRIAKLPVILEKNDREIVFSHSGEVDTASLHDLADACVLESLDDEIAVMRILIRRLLLHDPDNFDGIFKAMHLLVRMLKANKTLHSTCRRLNKQKVIDTYEG